ncbi:coproporphyrinogen dehydrogenase HemZ [Lachnospira multipara]|uniref:coproporphyrinogen dehydrogenase HemZ n=1 Tax=Lachnospira multipara TaxID=28051 RepID=UPI000480FB2B|nr:coproporphyrinogen dehydrogenase HemZ [Lachnospira multipara]
MIYINIDDDAFYDDAVTIVRSFYPRVDVKPARPISGTSDINNPATFNPIKEVTVTLNEGDRLIEIEAPDVTGLSKADAHEKFKVKLYKQLEQKEGHGLPWGNMTGVRPSKIAYQMIVDGKSEEEIIRFFTKEHFTTLEKARLAIDVAKKEISLVSKIDVKNGYSLYIGIPFCPSICLYCSFSAYAYKAYEDRVEQYVDALIKEISEVSKMMDGKRLDTVYFGGGTPTTLSPDQLDRILTCLEEKFDLENTIELTVEAGRPDSITRVKLQVLKNHNVERISINPQTMNQETLDLIGRKHSVEDIKKAYELASEMGFDNINMDIILGLPGEGPDEVANTVNTIKDMKPASLTVHSLAIKRSSRLNIYRDRYKNLDFKNTESIIKMTEECAKDLKVEPYYMYRQKNMAGNFENVGYAIPGKECIYNILIMEEVQSIIACGAGASTKIVRTNEKDGSTIITRVENVKNVDEYINRIDEMIERKRKELK